MRRLLSVLCLFCCGLACASLPRDSLARLDYTALVNKWGHVLDGYGYTHDPLGLRTNIVRDLGLTTSTVSVGYDPIGQVIAWSAKEANGTPRLNEQLGFGFDQAGNLHSRTNGGLIQTFTCDPVNELTNVTRNSTITVSGNTPIPAVSVTVNGQTAQTNGDFTFAATNQTLVNGTNTFTIIAANTYGVRTTNVTISYLPSAISLAYDLDGNLTNDGTRSFAYSAEDRLTNITAVLGNWKTDFVYDGLGRRRIARDYTNSSGAWSLQSETHYIYDGYQLIQERDGNNNVLVTYTRGLDLSGSLDGAGGIGGLLARTDTNGSAFYHADGAGNVTGLIDGNQTMAARYLYGPFGRLTGKWGPLADANVMQFSSMPVQRQSGLSLYPFRAYDPTLQRWLNRDPIGEAGGINLYTFVGNSPLNRVDPYGLDPAFSPGISMFSGLTASQQVQASRTAAPLTAALVASVATGGAADVALVGSGLMVEGSLATAVTVGAISGLAGDAAYQGTRIALGDQQGFSGTELAVSGALGAGVGGAVNKLSPLVKAKCPVKTGLGDLTPSEVNAIQKAVDEAETPLTVVGSAARGERTAASDIDTSSQCLSFHRP